MYHENEKSQRRARLARKSNDSQEVRGSRRCKFETRRNRRAVRAQLADL